MAVRMGRGVKYYPDYAIYFNEKKANERAKYILEAKYSINNEKQLKSAFYQAQSYALRLQSVAFIIADREYVWLFKTENHFPAPLVKFHWNELQIQDNINIFRKLLTR